MTEKQAREMIMEILHAVDYDLAKSLDPKTSEDPPEAKRRMRQLIALVQKHVASR